MRSMHVWDGVNGAHIDFDSRSIAVQRSRRNYRRVCIKAGSYSSDIC